MPTHETHDTHHKALSLNLDTTVFGSFAEIGAGQEVARWFLRVGGASGTVAKTISAYDKQVSDHLYGAGTRYVSKSRLEAMLESEWEQLIGQLHASRGADTKFFSFVDTVSARNYLGTNDCHGWVGLRFMREPGGAPNDVILHVNLRDPSNLRQQEAVGILGVNLIYAAYHALGSAREFLFGLSQELGLHRAEIDCLALEGPSFEFWDREEIHAFLVAGGYAEGVVFPADNQLVPPGELLYRRAVVLAPGGFDNVGQLHPNLIRDTLAQLPEEELKGSKGEIGLFCLSVGDTSSEGGGMHVKDIVERVKTLQELGFGVMIFRAKELYSMSAYANRYTKSRIHFAIGLTVLVRVFEDRYKDLAGTLLEGIARLFTQNVRLSVYPISAEEVQNRVKMAGLTGWRWKEVDGMVSADNLHPSGPLDSLYQYLLSSGLIIPGIPGKRAGFEGPIQMDGKVMNQGPGGS
jgi:hypothetical protein